MTDAALLAAEHWFARLARGDTAWSAPFAGVLLAEYHRRGALLADIAAAHCEAHGRCLDCEHPWPCVTYAWATKVPEVTR